MVKEVLIAGALTLPIVTERQLTLKEITQVETCVLPHVCKVEKMQFEPCMMPKLCNR